VGPGLGPPLHRSQDADPDFEKLAADLRKLTKGRRQTPSEVLLREGRDAR